MGRKDQANNGELYDKCKIDCKLQDRTVCCVNLEAQVDAPCEFVFDMLADPSQHSRIFDSIEAVNDTKLLEDDGPRRKWQMDYKTRWKFWKVGGVCDTLVYMWTDKDQGTVSFKLREPGFLKIYEGKWTITSPDKGYSRSTSGHSSSNNMLQDAQTGFSNLLASVSNPIMARVAGEHQPSSTPTLSHVDDTAISSRTNSSNSSLSSGPPRKRALTTIRIEKKMCPSHSPPYPLNLALKGNAVGQVQDMLRGVLTQARNAGVLGDGTEVYDE